MNVTKQIVVAGVVALALLAMPAGLSVRANGPELTSSLGLSVSTAYAASSSQQPIKAPTTGTTTGDGNGATTPGTLTTPGTWHVQQSGSIAHMQGFQSHPGKGGLTDSDCQQIADAIEGNLDAGFDASHAGNQALADSFFALADGLESAGLSQGCAFIVG
jgi:hypothetical protein